MPDNITLDKIEMVKWRWSKSLNTNVSQIVDCICGPPQRENFGAEQFPISSTGRDKCNTTRIQSIATSPNLHRKGSLLIDSFQFYDQFCMDLHSSIVKSWKQTSKTNQRPMCTRYGCSFPPTRPEKNHASRSTLSAHTAVEFHKTTCTISTLILLKPVVK